MSVLRKLDLKERSLEQQLSFYQVKWLEETEIVRVIKENPQISKKQWSLMSGQDLRPRRNLHIYEVLPCVEEGEIVEEAKEEPFPWLVLPSDLGRATKREEVAMILLSSEEETILVPYLLEVSETLWEITCSP